MRKLTIPTAEVEVGSVPPAFQVVPWAGAERSDPTGICHGRRIGRKVLAVEALVQQGWEDAATVFVRRLQHSTQAVCQRNKEATRL